MTTLQESDTRLPETVAEIRAAAATALDALAVRDRQEAADLLLFWRRRSELTPADEAAVLDTAFPANTRPSAEWSLGFAEGYLCAQQASIRAQRAAGPACGECGRR